MQRLTQITAIGGNSKQAYNAPEPKVFETDQNQPAAGLLAVSVAPRWNLSCSGSSRENGWYWTSGQDLGIGHDSTGTEDSDPA